jgi:hypothetical protein
MRARRSLAQRDVGRDYPRHSAQRYSHHSFSGCCALRTTAAPSFEKIKTDFVDALSRQTVEKIANPRPLLSDQLTLDIPPTEIQT